MNIISKLTLRHLKENKRRTLVTIIGVIISVAMITAVATLCVSFLDIMIRDEISRNGEWHVSYENVNREQIEAIKNDSETKTLVLSSDGYASFNESSNPNKPYFYFKNYNKQGFEQFPIQVIEGRLPQNKNEIAISEAIIDNAKVHYKIGDQLTFDIGERISTTDYIPLNQTDSLQQDGEDLFEQLNIMETKQVTIVGIIERPSWEPSWSPGYTVIGYVDEELLSEGDLVDLYITVNKINGSIYDHAKALAKKHGIEKVDFNSNLLRYYGVTANDNLRMTLFSLAGIIMAIIIIGSIALIYNAFAISVSDRARHLGMLASVGATRKQKRNSVIFEGIVIGAISIPIGILAGIGGIGVTFLYINTYLSDALGVAERLELVVTPASIIVACVISMLTIFLSSYIPARRASKISAIDAIRQTHDIKLSRKSVKTSKLVRKLFGIEAEIGLKNMKRYRKRYLATLFSLVISIVLFLTVNFFTANLKKSLEMTQDAYQFDILIQSGNDIDREEILRYTQLDFVTESTIKDEAHLHTHVPLEQLPTVLKKDIEEFDIPLEDGKYPYFVALHGLDEESFKRYAEQIGVKAEEYIDQDTPKGIVIERIKYEDAASRKIIELKTIHADVGERLELFDISHEAYDNGETEWEFVETLEIGALTNQVPMGVESSQMGIGGLDIIVPQAALEELGIDTVPYVYLKSSDPMGTQTAIEELNDADFFIMNVHQMRQKEEQTLLLMSIFIYGFITLITLISIANIFNTISTSVALRKREFAMLRSVGITPKGFNKMIYYESIFYGVKALAYGLPISFLVMLAIHKSIGYTFEYGFQFPWISILFVVVLIFIIVGLAMRYSMARIRNENIIDSLKQENI